MSTSRKYAVKSIMEKIQKSVSYKDLLDKAEEVFLYDKDKVLSWYTRNAKEFGGLSPFQMCKNGKGRTVIQYLEKTLVL